MPTFSPQQVATGKQLVKWLMNKGSKHDYARREVAGLLVRHPLLKIRQAMERASTLEDLKKTLMRVNTFAKEKQED